MSENAVCVIQKSGDGNSFICLKKAPQKTNIPSCAHEGIFIAQRRCLHKPVKTPSFLHALLSLKAKLSELHLLDELHATSDGCLIHRNELMVALRQSLVETLDHVIYRSYRTHLQQAAEDEHVEHLGVA